MQKPVAEEKDARKFLASCAYSLVIPEDSRYYCVASISSFAAEYVGAFRKPWPSPDQGRPILGLLAH
jgi:hypothetical protein